MPLHGNLKSQLGTAFFKFKAQGPRLNGEQEEMLDLIKQASMRDLTDITQKRSQGYMNHQSSLFNLENLRRLCYTSKENKFKSYTSL